MSLFLFKKRAMILKLKVIMKQFLMVMNFEMGTASTRVFSVNSDTNAIAQDTLTELNPNSWVYGAQFSRDGKYLVVGAYDNGRVQFWRRNKDTFVRMSITNLPTPPNALPGAPPVYGVAISPDGKYAAAITSTEGAIYIFKLSADGLSYAYHLRYGGSGGVSENNKATAISPDGLHFLRASHLANSISIYKKLNETSFTDVPAISKPDSATWEPNCMVYSEDGNFLFVCAFSSNYSLTVYRRDGDTYTRVAGANHYSRSTSLTVSPDGKHIAITAEGSVFLSVYKWDAVTMQLTKLSIPALGKHAYSVSYSSDGKILAVGYQDSANTNKVAFFSRNGDVYVRITSPAISDSTTGKAIVLFSPV